MSAVLVDTNVLVYAHDRGEFVKQARAIDVMEFLLDTNSGWLSVQSLSEFFNIVTRRQNPKLTVPEAEEQIEGMMRAWRVVDLTPQIGQEAIRGVRTHQMSIWDAQIWAAARLNQLPIVLTEDLPSGVVLEGVRFVNPFAEDFLIEQWV